MAEMATSNVKKGSRFLIELEEYYSARKKYSNSFKDTPCPQNFIPGATKPKKNVRNFRTMSRKVSSVCYKGVVVQMKDNMTAVEKGVIPGGLLALALPSPSQHTSCLEHKIEQILQRNSMLLSNATTLADTSIPEGPEIQGEEDEFMRGSVKSKHRACSLPMTSRDIGTLPVISYGDDDNVAADFRSMFNYCKGRRHSFPLTHDEYNAYWPNLRKFRTVENAAVDSVARLGAFCRGISYYGSSSAKDLFAIQGKRGTGVPTYEAAKKVCGRSYSCVQQTSKAESIIEDEPEFPWQKQALEDEGNKRSSTVDEKGIKMTRSYSDPEDHKDSSKLKHPTSKAKSLKQRFSFKKAKGDRDDEDDNNEHPSTNKETLSQIQNALRAKLPKTLQATVKVGLSFDPVTVTQRNNRARDCKTLTAMLSAKDRARSLPGSPALTPRKERSKTFNTALAVPSLVVSPPTYETSDEVSVTESVGLLDNLLKLGKDTLSRKIDRWSRRMKKDKLKSPSTSDIEIIQSLSASHAKKLENVLGSDFGETYERNRSRSLPLIRKSRRIKESKSKDQARSTTEIGRDGNDSMVPPTLDLWSSIDTSDSDASYLQTSQDVSAESEVSDYEDVDGIYCEGKDLTKRGIASDLRNKQNSIFSSPQVVIFLPTRDTKNGVTDVASNGLSNTGHMSEKRTAKIMSGDVERWHSHSECMVEKGTSSHENCQFRVETSYVFNKSKLLKSSKQLLEESKGHYSENIDYMKHSKKNKKLKIKCINRSETLESGSAHSDTDGDNSLSGKSLERKERNNAEKMAINGTGNNINNQEPTIETVNTGNIDAACENELKELDALLTELQTYTVD